MAEQKKAVHVSWFFSLSRKEQSRYTVHWKFALPEEYFHAKSYITSDTVELCYNKLSLQKNGLSLFINDEIEYYDHNDIIQKGKIYSFMIRQIEGVDSPMYYLYKLKRITITKYIKYQQGI